MCAASSRSTSTDWLYDYPAGPYNGSCAVPRRSRGLLHPSQVRRCAEADLGWCCNHRAMRTYHAMLIMYLSPNPRSMPCVEPRCRCPRTSKSRSQKALNVAPWGPPRAPACWITVGSLDRTHSLKDRVCV